MVSQSYYWFFSRNPRKGQGKIGIVYVKIHSTRLLPSTAFCWKAPALPETYSYSKGSLESGHNQTERTVSDYTSCTRKQCSMQADECKTRFQPILTSLLTVRIGSPQLSVGQNSRLCLFRSSDIVSEKIPWL